MNPILSASSSPGALRLLAALTLLNVLNFADRFLLVAFSPDIVSELGLTHLQFGMLTGIAFTALYTVLGFFTGALADRVHRPRLISAGLALWSALTAATGVAASFAQMVGARLFVGVGEATLTPAAMSMIADRVPPGRRALYSGLYYLGLPAGIGGSFLFAGAFGPALGWRGSFLLLGGVGVIASLLVLLAMREPSRGAADGVAQVSRPQSFGDSLRAMANVLGSNPVFGLTLAGSTAVIFAQGAAVLDLLWWVRERGYATVEAQRITGLVFMLGGMLGAVAGGIGADWAHRRFSAGRLRFLGWSFLVAVPLCISYRLVPGHGATFYGLAVAAAAVPMLVYGPGFSTVQELVPVQHRAAAVGLLLLCVALIGGGGGNAAAGWLADYLKAGGVSNPLTIAILGAQTVGILAVPLFFAAARLQAKDPTLPASAVPETAQ